MSGLGSGVVGCFYEVFDNLLRGCWESFSSFASFFSRGFITRFRSSFEGFSTGTRGFFVLYLFVGGFV